MKRSSLELHPANLSSQYQRAIRKADRDQLMHSVMTRKAGVYTSDRSVKRLIANRLGWVDSADLMRRKIGEIESFGKSTLASGIKHIVLMGMGGSSLCPELFAVMFGKHPKLKSFDVIDSTDPAAIKAVRKKIQIDKTLFIVSSKSGGTVETRSHESFFISELKKAGVRAFGKHFTAITDKGSALEKFGRRNRYRKLFINPSDIGGRYSALSYFGLVPAFFAGVPIRDMINKAVEMQEIIKSRSGEVNPALALGCLISAAARSGNDKLTFVTSNKCAPFVPWIEQLVAESTGKKKKGVVPIEAETAASLAKYGKDRLFIFLNVEGERNRGQSVLTTNLKRKQIPFVEIRLGSLIDLGSQFLLWEAATAVVGFHLAINPFDEPNVTESKLNTNAILERYLATGHFPFEEPLANWPGLALLAIGGKTKFSADLMKDPARFLRRFLRGARPPKYLAALGYFHTDKRSESEFIKLRDLLRSKSKMATLRGYGPRFLHSIGQLYKGGPANGLFVIFVRRKYGSLDIPDKEFNFGELIRAQAFGDAQGLMKRKLPTLVVSFDGHAADAIGSFTRLVRRALK